MNISPSELKTIITDPKGTETLVKVADNLGKQLKNARLATNQIRALFGEVRQIEAQWKMGEKHRPRALRRLILLKPKMRYRTRKERGPAVKELVDVLEPALDLVLQENDALKQSDNFRQFVEFFEAILAYHKAYGGN
ncbi:MAG: type III-A CRISPR-associated protein Csm2 [Chloroflexota bacterium]